MNPRIVDVFEFARLARCVEAGIPVGQMPRLASLLSGPAAPVRAEYQGRVDERGRSAARLRLQATLPLTCDRCGRPCDWPLDTEAGFFFVGDESALHAEPITAEGDEPLVGSRHFDWWDLVEDQAILSLPISPRHPDCAAAASSTSGAGRAAPASAHPAPGDAAGDGERRRPFAVLAALKKGGNGVK